MDTFLANTVTDKNNIYNNNLSHKQTIHWQWKNIQANPLKFLLKKTKKTLHSLQGYKFNEKEMFS